MSPEHEKPDEINYCVLTALGTHWSAMRLIIDVGLRQRADGINVNISNINCAPATKFMFDRRMDGLEKYM